MERLYRAAKELKGIANQAELARALNQSSQTVNNWEARGMSKAGMLKAQEELGCSAVWLQTGVGPMTVMPVDALDMPDGDFMRILVAEPDEPSVVQIPKVKLHLSAGIMGFQTEPDTFDGASFSISSEWMLRRGYRKDQLLAIRIKGESMEPTLYEDDFVVVNVADKQLVDGVVFAFNYEGEAVVKRALREAGQWYLSSDNPAPKFGRRLCRSGDCNVIGRIVKREGDRL
jgi:phage repressor protein C with HTH and peptisase S24 domain